MDKRILIYFVVLIGTFFLVNEYFNAPKSPEKAPNVVTTQPIQIDPSLRDSSPITLSEEKLFNLVKLYDDANLTRFVTYAIQQEMLFLTLSWQDSLPNYLYARYDMSINANINRLELQINPGKKSAPALYAIYLNQKLRVPNAPVSGSYDIRLLDFSHDNQEVRVIYGEVSNGAISKLSANPSKPSLVLINFEDHYFPYAIFDPQTQRLTQLIELPNFEVRANVVLPQLQSASTEQQYYVLENEYIQLVFSTLNGALSEINLPFVSEAHPKSVVREIDIDRIMQKDYPIADSFPQFPYSVPDNAGLQQPTVGGYYPLLRRDIIGIGGKPETRVPPYYYGFSLVSVGNKPEISKYELKRFEKNLIEFEMSEGNRRVTKTFSLPANADDAPYCFDIAVKVEGDARGLQICPGLPEAELISGSFTPVLKYQVTRNQKQVVEKIDQPKKMTSFSHLQPNWVCNGNGFFGLIVNPTTPLQPGLTLHPVSGELVPSRLSIIDAEYQRFPASKYPACEVHIPLAINPAMTKFRVFAGPFDRTVLTRVDTTFTNPQTGENPNFIASQSFQGWFAFISEPFAKFLFILMNFFHTITNSWGLSILLLTIALRIMLYPLNHWSIKSTLKMQMIAPKVTAIQEKYKKDPKQAQMQIMNLYRQEGVNPFSGCLPLLIQMPFLIGMFDLLKSTFELRGASFIPGWIDNLTAPDVVFCWSYPIVFFGNCLHLLPILLGVVMYLQQRYSASAGKSPDGKMTDQQRQQKVMGNIMVIVFTVMFYNFPSGLNLYWLFSMLLGIAQQWWTTRQMAKAAVVTTISKK